jgi:hypothetical protein
MESLSKYITAVQIWSYLASSRRLCFVPLTIPHSSRIRSTVAAVIRRLHEVKIFATTSHLQILGCVQETKGL